MDYNTYILSPEWQSVRRSRLRTDNYTCQECYRKHDLQVHHLTYKRLGDERIEDLITLCVRCHNNAEELKAQVEIGEKAVLRQTKITQKEWENAKIRAMSRS